MVDHVDGTSVIEDVHPGQSAPEHPELWRRTLPPLLVSPTAPPLELFEPIALPPASEIAEAMNARGVLVSDCEDLVEFVIRDGRGQGDARNGRCARD